MDKKEILVVDDDVITVNMLKSTLTKAGYGVKVALNGLEAIRISKEHLPFMIILDIMMPGIDGGEVADILKNDPKTMDIPIIFLSSLVAGHEEKIGAGKDVLALFSKPYDRDKLLNEVRKYVHRVDALRST
jgi:CheY-like chemotaxis protein